MATRALRLVGLEQCGAQINREFSLRDMSSGLWLGTPSDSNEWKLVEASRATAFWGLYAGQLGLHGRLPFFYLFEREGAERQCLSHDPRLAWEDCATSTMRWQTENHTELPPERMMFHAVTQHFDHFPTSTLLGACPPQVSLPIEANFSAQAANCSYVTYGSSALSLTLGPAADAIELQWICRGSVQLNWTGAMFAAIVGLVLLAAFPFAAVWHVRRRPLPSQQWPAAPRSPLAWVVLLISWVLCLAGATPPLLAYVGQGWRWQTGPYTALVVLGLPGLLTSMRPDDHPTSA